MFGLIPLDNAARDREATVLVVSYNKQQSHNVHGKFHPNSKFHGSQWAVASEDPTQFD
jgi:hypothetical protein